MKKDIIVQKFGGTSVADVEKIKNVARAVIREKENGNDVVVVVSAMGHTTDYLVKMAHDLNPNPSAREMDMLLSTGEGVSIALLALAIQAQGYEAESLNAMQIGIHTENIHMKARITDIDTTRLELSLSRGKIIVVAGFQGVTEGNEITTLGRGGSDISAVALAAALGANRELFRPHPALNKFLTKKCLNLHRQVQMFFIPEALKPQKFTEFRCA